VVGGSEGAEDVEFEQVEEVELVGGWGLDEWVGVVPAVDPGAEGGLGDAEEVGGLGDGVVGGEFGVLHGGLEVAGEGVLEEGVK
jgi:hypothetical protein